jgi:hypothetical protein
MPTPTKRPLIYIAMSAWLLCLAQDLWAKELTSLVHQKTAPILDGQLTDVVWATATQVYLDYQHHPDRGAPANVITRAYIYEDGKYLHIAMQAFDPHPEKLRANLLDRDKAWDDDLLGITIDTFNDERSGYEFYLNPLGVQIDSRMEDNNGWQSNDSWDAIWEGKALVTETGWQIEMSIPFKALRFPKRAGKKVWGMAFYRAYQGEILHWLSDAPIDTRLECTVCQFTKFEGFESVSPGKNIQLTPTLTLGRSDTKPALPGPWQEGDIEQEPGLDFRWGMTESSVLNATFNPDFSQVEADAAQLDINNPFTLFLEEKRLFFVDGADYFSTHGFKLTHSRNIADPNVGLKITGKTGRFSYATLLADDNSTQFILPGNQGSAIATIDNTESNIAIARSKVDIGARSELGAYLSHRRSDDYQNTVVSVDGKAWLSSIDTLVYQFSQSESDNPTVLQARFGLAPKDTGSAASIKYTRDTRHYTISTGYENITENFRADLGFVDENNLERITATGTFKRYGDEGAFFRRSYYTLNGHSAQDQNGQALNDTIEANTRWEGIYQSQIELTLKNKKQLYALNPSLSEGEYFKLNTGTLYTHFRPWPNLRMALSATAGDEIDFANAQKATLLDTNIGLDINAGKHLLIKLSHSHVALSVDSSQQQFDDITVNFSSGRLFTAQQTDIRINYQFNIQSQLKLVFTYTDIERDPSLYHQNFDAEADNDIEAEDRYLSSQIVYSHKLNPRSLLYIGYSDSTRTYTTDSASYETRLSQDSRSVFAKFSYAWQ